MGETQVYQLQSIYMEVVTIAIYQLVPKKQAVEGLQKQQETLSAVFGYISICEFRFILINIFCQLLKQSPPENHAIFFTVFIILWKFNYTDRANALDFSLQIVFDPIPYHLW